jgi:hypothetical protein
VSASKRVHGHARDCETCFDAVAYFEFFRQIAAAPWATTNRNPVFRKRGMQSVVVKFRNLFTARVVLFTAVTAARPDAEPFRSQPAPVANSTPMTHSRAARECWMRTEKGSAHENLDKRAELVNKCIDEKLKAAGVSSPRS